MKMVTFPKKQVVLKKKKACSFILIFATALFTSQWTIRKKVLSVKCQIEADIHQEQGNFSVVPLKSQKSLLWLTSSWGSSPGESSEPLSVTGQPGTEQSWWSWIICFVVDTWACWHYGEHGTRDAVTPVFPNLLRVALGGDEKGVCGCHTYLICSAGSAQLAWLLDAEKV